MSRNCFRPGSAPLENCSKEVVLFLYEKEIFSFNPVLGPKIWHCLPKSFKTVTSFNSIKKNEKVET